MSADNWAACPVCLAKAREAVEAEQEKVRAAYGSLPIAEWDTLRAAAPVFDADSSEHRTFREDYEVWGAEEGVVHYSYRGQCASCGACCKFEGSHPVRP